MSESDGKDRRRRANLSIEIPEGEGDAASTGSSPGSPAPAGAPAGAAAETPSRRRPASVRALNTRGLSTNGNYGEVGRPMVMSPTGTPYTPTEFRAAVKLQRVIRNRRRRSLIKQMLSPNSVNQRTVKRKTERAPSPKRRGHAGGSSSRYLVAEVRRHSSTPAGVSSRARTSDAETLPPPPVRRGISDNRVSSIEEEEELIPPPSSEPRGRSSGRSRGRDRPTRDAKAERGRGRPTGEAEAAAQQDDLDAPGLERRRSLVKRVLTPKSIKARTEARRDNMAPIPHKRHPSRIDTSLPSSRPPMSKSATVAESKKRAMSAIFERLPGGADGKTQGQ